VSPSPGGHFAMIFRACSSLETTQTKLHPTPVILCQESAHTTLSITHHLEVTIHWSSDTPGPQSKQC
jgi:hypothetical protein